MVFGKHIIIDANLCDEKKIKDLNNIKNFIDVLCKIGRMEKKGDLIIELFPENV